MHKKSQAPRCLPSLPIVMASDTPMALYCQASIFCLLMDFFTMLPNSSTAACQLLMAWAMIWYRLATHDACWVSESAAGLRRHGRLPTYLQGLPSHHIVATPTCGAFFMVSSSGTPAPYSIAYRVQRVSAFIAQA